jgi:hypothetical protein
MICPEELMAKSRSVGRLKRAMGLLAILRTRANYAQSVRCRAELSAEESR